MSELPASLPALRGALKERLSQLVRAAGFLAPRIGALQPTPAAVSHLTQWLKRGWHGGMDYMQRNLPLRVVPQGLHPPARCLISVALPYLSDTPAAAWEQLAQPSLGYIARYALGRDYHQVVRGRLQRCMQDLAAVAREWGHPEFSWRVVSDSAPLLEVTHAAQAGLGWAGKHTLLLRRDAGSFFFLGEILTDLELEPDHSGSRNHCGSCRACLDRCPTGAIVAPGWLDARRCIAYLTIEWRGSIPVELRPALGNRIYGCDDCQLACPWNRFATVGNDPAFQTRSAFDHPALVEFFKWSRVAFEQNLAGSPLRRIGYSAWLRNLAVALGNGPATSAALQALRQRTREPDPLVREHVQWALERLESASFTPDLLHLHGGLGA